LAAVQLIAEGTATPVDYPAIGYITACASLIGGKRRVRPYQSSNWAEPCIIWAGVVGDPSSRKSPALDTVTERLRNIERDPADQFKDALRTWKEGSERAKASRSDWEKAVSQAVKEGKDNLAYRMTLSIPTNPCAAARWLWMPPRKPSGRSSRAIRWGRCISATS
jgi:hypothetical protein